MSVQFPSPNEEPIACAVTEWVFPSEVVTLPADVEAGTLATSPVDELYESPRIEGVDVTWTAGVAQGATVRKAMVVVFDGARVNEILV
jgi:hypothetical protein